MVNLSTKSFPGAQFWLARERLGLMPRKPLARRFWVKGRSSIDSSNSDVHVPPPPDQEYDDEGDGDPWGADGEFDAWGGGGGFDGADSQFAIR